MSHKLVINVRYSAHDPNIR